MLSRALPIFVWFASLALLGCADAPTGLDPHEASFLSAVPSKPKLRKPVGTSIKQNNPASGCPDAGVRGKGFLIHFDWADSKSSEGVTGYDILVQRNGSQYPLMNCQTAGSAVTYRGCGFVIDANLKGWEWKVRARGPDGAVGDWSEVGQFQFKPCRLGDGSPCRTG